jgi:hypothetical protein
LCFANCTETYAVGTPVQLTATPSFGWSFVGFIGDADCVDGNLQMTAPAACRATFQQTAAALEDNTGP